MFKIYNCTPHKFRSPFALDALVPHGALAHEVLPAAEGEPVVAAGGGEVVLPNGEGTGAGEAGLSLRGVPIITRQTELALGPGGEMQTLLRKKGHTMDEEEGR